MHIIVNNTSMTPIYEQIMEQVKTAIINGELTENLASLCAGIVKRIEDQRPHSEKGV